MGVLKRLPDHHFKIIRAGLPWIGASGKVEAYSADDLHVNPVSDGSFDTPGIYWMHACKARQCQMGGIAPAHKISPTLMS